MRRLIAQQRHRDFNILTPKNEDTANDSMSDLRRHYGEYLEECRELLAGLAQTLKTGDLNGLERDALLDLAHKLIGTGATYGFPRVSTAARHIEELLTTKVWTPEALVALIGGKGLSQREYHAMVGRVHKLVTLCATLGLKAQGDAAAYLGEAMGKKVYVPRATLIWHIEALIEACAAARTEKPASFKAHGQGHRRNIGLPSAGVERGAAPPVGSPRRR